MEKCGILCIIPLQKFLQFDYTHFKMDSGSNGLVHPVTSKVDLYEKNIFTKLLSSFRYILENAIYKIGKQQDCRSRRRKVVEHTLQLCRRGARRQVRRRPWESLPAGPALELHVSGLEWAHTSRGPLEISPALGTSGPHGCRVDLLDTEAYSARTISTCLL
jgi:hypothetical protein